MDLHNFILNHRVGQDNVKGGFTLFDYFDFERKFYNHILDNRFSIIKKSRQMHVTTMLAAYVAWDLLNDSDEPKHITYISNNYDASCRFKLFVDMILIEYGIDKPKKKNTREITLKNGNTLRVAAATPDAIKGYTSTCIIIDNAAYINKFDDMLTALTPTLSLKNTKMIIASTPNGFNGFFNLYGKAEIGVTEFKPLSLHYSMNPKYSDPEWYKSMCSSMNNDARMIAQELECEFVAAIAKPKNNKPNLIQFRLDDETIKKIGVKLVEQDINMSTYLRNLIKADLK